MHSFGVAGWASGSDCVFWGAKTVHVTKMLHDVGRVFYHQCDLCFKDRMMRCVMPKYSIMRIVAL